MHLDIYTESSVLGIRGYTYKIPGDMLERSEWEQFMWLGVFCRLKILALSI